MLTVYHYTATLFNIMKAVQHAELEGAVGVRLEDPAPETGSKLVKSAVRTLDILELLGQADRALTLTEIAVALKLPKSSVHLLIQTLVARGYLEAPSSSGPFQLGLRVMELAGERAAKTHFLQQFPAIARDLVAACEETVQLAILDGRHVVYLAKQDGTRPVRLVSNVGKRLPAHVTALGKILLAALPDAELSALFSGCALEQMTSRTIGTFDSLMEEISRVRAEAYAVDDEEAVEGLKCFAAPVWDSNGKTVAAISVSAPKTRVASEDVSRYVALIKEASCQLSRRIGHVPSV